MTARDKFTVNQTVVATPKFFARHRRYRGTTVTGIVRGFSVTGQGVRVQILGGSNSVSRYPMSMWEPIPRENESS
jgi:hypothetical protein